MALPVAGFQSKVFWDKTKVTARGTNGWSGATTIATAANAIAICIAANEVGWTKDEIAWGGDANPHTLEPRGQGRQVQIAGQATVSEVMVPISFDFESTTHKDIRALEPGAAIALGIVEAYRYQGPLKDAFPGATAGAGKIDKFIITIIEGQVLSNRRMEPVAGEVAIELKITQGFIDEIQQI